jgi:hypothetical protein
VNRRKRRNYQCGVGVLAGFENLKKAGLDFRLNPGSFGKLELSGTQTSMNKTLCRQSMNMIKLLYGRVKEIKSVNRTI